jgi:FkbM family methyltransferase
MGQSDSADLDFSGTLITGRSGNKALATAGAATVIFATGVRRPRPRPRSLAMDRFWHDVADFLAKRGSTGGHIVAPIEFASAIAVDVAYRNTTLADAPQVSLLVLHKGLYRELDRRFLDRALRRLYPVFANEVFVVFADMGQSLPDDNPHIGELPEIAAWAAKDEEVQSPSGRRMTATYVGDGAVLAETIHGQLMVLPAADRGITPHIIRDGYFDLGLTRFLGRYLRPGMTYVDVGANVGVYLLLAASSVGARGRVVAIEALPRLQRFLTDNLSMNGLLDRALILPFAAADREGELTFYDFAHYTGSSTASAVIAQRGERRLLERANTLTVQVKTLSAMLHQAETRSVDLIKIDVEGFECEVLQGARDFLSAQRKIALLVEWHLEHMSVERQELLYGMLVDELGCRLEAVEGDGSTRSIGYDELLSVAHADLFALREAEPP